MDRYIGTLRDVESQQQQPGPIQWNACTTAANVRGGQEDAYICVGTYHSVGCPSGMVFLGASTTAVDMLVFGVFFLGGKRTNQMLGLFFIFMRMILWMVALLHTRHQQERIWIFFHIRQMHLLEYWFSSQCVRTNRDTTNAAYGTYTRCAPQ
jgi:hypothetical protein